MPDPKRRHGWARIWPWVGLGARLLLGGVWLVAGALKLPDPAESLRAVRAYQLLPESAVSAVGYGLPVLEVAIGVLLIVGVTVRLSAVVSAVVLAAFIFAIATAWARGLQIDCGCFGGGGQIAAADTRYPQEIARDIALLTTAVALTIWPRTRLALGTALKGTDSTEGAGEIGEPDNTRSADPSDKKPRRLRR